MTTHPISIESAGGEYMETVLILAWATKPGDRVKAGDLVVTVETAKAATEVEASHDGWLAEIHFAEGQEAPVGAVLGIISDTQPRQEAETVPVMPAKAAIGAPADDTAAGRPTASTAQAGPARVIASPLARRIARQSDIDLAGIAGTGPHGRIKQRDVLAALHAPASKVEEPATQPATKALPAPRLESSARSIPIVLLHGFAADRSAWRQVIPLLPAEFEILTPDLPGHGANAARPAGNIEELAQSVSDELRASGIERAHLVGHSLGGATALALTAIGRLAVQSLTLIAPGGLGPEINGGFITGLTQSTTPEALERWLKVMVGDDTKLPLGYARAILRQMESIGNRQALDALAHRLFSNGTQVFDVLPSLKTLNVPTRVIWGRADQVIPASHANQLPDFAALHLLSGVGHVPQLEAPALTAKLITQTVRSAG